ncbi:DASS family sodium-coupled anion symporter [Hahella sp. CR1]|uniref:SLC13 family permease n=1 Tax=Hahella sp. CR1 TaxID=2992807 RepID=UPI002441D837|nr:DASS family sodium-coupled anion symporter [Hahella sp. CR1]MDG9672127.1 DASS family sodium-coupled anion symporter [Hahella sp. CR1]
MRLKLIGIILAAGPLCLETLIQAPADARHGLSILWIAAVLWMTELLHVTVTALLIPIMAVTLGLLSVREGFSEFANPIIFLFLGGFALASALHKQQVDSAIAAKVLRLTRGKISHALILLCALSALLSMWISNTATTAIMMPLVLGLLSQENDRPDNPRVFALLAVAYSASIGGVATLVGSPPNAIVAAQLGMSFSDWIQLGLPVTLMLWPVMLFILYKALRPDLSGHAQTGTRSDFTWTRERLILLGIFSATVAMWLFSKPLGELLGIEKDLDSWIAILALVALTVSKVVAWKDVSATTDWGVLLLFGGGLTLSVVLKSSGASQLLGESLAALVAAWPAYLLLLTITAFVIFLTELSSNTATAALLVPIFLALPTGQLSPEQTALTIGIAASCAFMLPVATPPNAIVHGTGLVPQKTMVRIGFYLNLACALLVSAFIFFFA